RHGREIALDIAFQASPDHPWVREHTEWFSHRPDGTIKYAENPPKKYQDIYPINFESEAWQALWIELKNVITFWVGHGVTIFRVDNPHTKPLRFWEWALAEIKLAHPDTIFLSEAYTRPGNFAGLIARVNQVRKAHPALQRDWGLRFHRSENPRLLCYSKRSEDGTDLLLMVVNLDPFHMQHGFIEVPLGEWGRDPSH